MNNNNPRLRAVLVAMLAASALSHAAVSDPIVFVSRQILDQGSVFYAPAKAMPGTGPHSRFRPAAPGKLLVREANGSIRALVDGANPTATSLNLIDVNAPSVSFDGQRIVFAGLPAPAAGQTYSSNPGEPIGAWRLYVINADGSGLRKLPIPETVVNLAHFGHSGAWSFDDTYPCWLPDGRIVFSSTRWVVYGQYSGMIGSNLFVVNADGTNLRRITSERSGADRASVDPLTGKIVFARWWRNYRFPTDLLDTVTHNNNGPGFARHLGLSSQFDPNPPARTAQFEANMWTPAVINPDGTGLAAFALFFRGNENMNHYYGGAFAPDGTLYANYFPMENMTEAAGFGGIRRLTRGANRYQHIIGNTRRFEQPQITPTSFGVEASPSGYAADPAPMRDGTLLISLAVADRATLTGADVTQDYGLYNIDPDNPATPVLIYDQPGTAELQAQVLAPRALPPIIADTARDTASALPPTAAGPYDIDGTFTFHALNVYANGPVDMDIVNAPAVGSAATIKFFIDHQRASLGSFPALDWPILLEELPVNANGSVRTDRAPANVQLFEQLRSADGTVPATKRGLNLDGGAHVAGMNYGRPGTVVRCVGCHAGHTLLPVPARDEDALWSNLAPGAAVTASSRRQSLSDPGYVVDRRVRKANIHWESAAGVFSAQWLKLTFPADINVRAVRVYDGKSGACAIPATDIRLFSDAAGTQQVAQNLSGALATSGTDVPFQDVKARVVQINLGIPASCGSQDSLSVAEVEVIAAGASVAAPGSSNPPPSNTTPPSGAATSSASTTGGGGGCAIGSSAPFDPLLPALLALPAIALIRKRLCAMRIATNPRCASSSRR